MAERYADERWAALAAETAAADEHDPDHPHTCCGPTRRQLLAWAGAWSAFAAAGLWSPQAVAAAEAAAPALTSSASPDDAISGGVWLCGDTHVHSDHSSDGSAPRQLNSDQAPGNVSVADQIGEGSRVGLDWMPLTDHRTYDQHWDPLWTSSDLLLVPGEEANGRPHSTVLGAVDEVVDGADTAPGHRRLQQNIWDARAQAASWGIAHPDDGELENGAPNAFAMAVGMHTVEAWNKGSNCDLEIDYCEGRWNAGWRFGVAGAGDNHFRELWAIAGPGSPTTWVLATDRSERGVLDGLRAGHTTISTSPLSAFVTLEADLDRDGTFEAIGGDEVAGLVAGTAVRLRVRAQRALGHKLVVLQAPGRAAAPLATFTVTSLDETHVIDTVVPAGESWWRVEVRGAGAPASIDPKRVLAELQAGSFVPPTLTDQLQAIVSPIFTSTGAPARPRQDVTVGVGAPPQDGVDDAVPASAPLDDPGVFHGFPDVVADTVAGGVHVVAERHDLGATRAVYTRVGADGAPADVIVLSGDATTARLPRIAAAGARLWAVWQEEQTGQLPRKADIVARTSADGGRTWQAPLRLSAGGGLSRNERPAVAVDPADPTKPLVAWTGNITKAFDVFAIRLGVDLAPQNVSGAGKVLSEGDGIDTRSPRWPASLHPSVAIAPDGTQAIAWQDDRYDADPLWSGQNGAPDDTQGPDSWEPVVAMRAPGGTWSTPVRVAPDPARVQSSRHPQVAFSDGGLVVVWTTKEREESGKNLALVWSRSSDGAAWTAPAAVDPAPEAMAQRPRLGSDPDGSLRVVWSDTRGADWRWHVRSARLAPGTAGWTDAQQVSGRGNGTFPVVHGGHVAFSSDRSARPQHDVSQAIVTMPLAVDGGASPIIPEIPVPALAVGAAVAIGAAALATREVRAR